MRPIWLYSAGVLVFAVLTVLIFAADMPPVLSTVVQVLWVALIFVLCLLGARDIRRNRLAGRTPSTDGLGLSGGGTEGSDPRPEADKGATPPPTPGQGLF